MVIMHMANSEGEYLCSNYIRMNPLKITSVISLVNCKECLKRIAENDFTRTELSINQTSLKGVIYE